MIWLASYPRSGNTFLRIVLDEVYGLASSTFHRQAEYPLDENYAQYPVVKTHELPGDVVPNDPRIPVAYLVRDGRDCVVSLAHYRRQLQASDSDLRQNLIEAIEAQGGSYFGGWSEHVRQWLPRAQVVLRFEELIRDPIACVERLRPWLPLPPPRRDRVPSFHELRLRDFRYGSGAAHGFAPKARERWRLGKFRSGQVGGWKQELGHDLHLRFLERHGAELLRLGYEPLQPPTLTVPPLTKEPASATSGAPAAAKRSVRRPRRVLIDALKLSDARMDGIKRYVVELLRGLQPIAERESRRIEFHLALPGWQTLDLREAGGLLAMREPVFEVPTPPVEPAPPMTEASAEFALPAPAAANPSARAPLSSGGVWQGAKELAKRLIGRERCRQMRLGYNAVRNGVGREARRQTEWLRRRFEARPLPVAACEEYPAGFDLIHLTLPNTWEAFRGVQARFLTTVHDLCHVVCPELQAVVNIHGLRDGLDFAVRRRSSFLTVSAATAERLVEEYPWASGRTTVIHETCGPEFIRVQDPGRLAALRARYELGTRPYALVLGTLEPRKNLINTVHAFRRLLAARPDLDVQLAIAGQLGWQCPRELEAAFADEPRIRRLGYVPDEDLPALYSGAALFSYVSHYEGFGLPPLEAMCCGVPVVYGRNSSLPEVIGNAGLAVPSRSVPAIAKAFEQLFTDAGLRGALAAQGLLRSRCFTRESMAEATFEAYERCLAGVPVGDESRRCAAA